MGGTSDSPQSVKEISRSAGSKFPCRPASDPQKEQELHLSPGMGAQVSLQARAEPPASRPTPSALHLLNAQDMAPGAETSGYLGAPDPSSRLKNLLKVSRPRHQEANPNSEARPQRDPAVGLFRSRHPLSPATGREASDVRDQHYDCPI